jgi:hypothetical protein
VTAFEPAAEPERARRVNGRGFRSGEMQAIRWLIEMQGGFEAEESDNGGSPVPMSQHFIASIDSRILFKNMGLRRRRWCVGLR